jgi:hypothetical protein
LINTRASPKKRNVAPPNFPWQPLSAKPLKYATLTFYFSDSKSEILPIRDVSCKGDPKPDPNYETMTYGLFSGCCKDERKSIVEKGLNIQFFCTSRGDNIRVLTGYYLPAWYCSIGEGDYAIAAKSAHFISPGFVLSDLIEFLGGYRIDKFFRRWKYLPESVANRLLFLLDSVPDATPKYILKIKSLEKCALKNYGVLYHNRLRGFGWEEAAKLFSQKKVID